MRIYSVFSLYGFECFIAAVLDGFNRSCELVCFSDCWSLNGLMVITFVRA